MKLLYRSRVVSAFTLIELLTVIAIISLLIGILVPALSRAREQAKNTKTRAAMKAIGDGLEMFRNDNPTEVRGDAYPSSAAADDPTEQGQQYIYGAQWIVRYMMGKDLRGFVAKKTGQGISQNVQQYWEQRDWYSDVPTTENPRAPLPRQGPYLNPDSVKVAAPKDLPGGGATPPGGLGQIQDAKTMEQFVFLDAFEFPILYYSGNPILARDPVAPMATFDGTRPGVYNFKDNALFSGMCKGDVCTTPPWDFDGSHGHHGIQDFGQFTNDIPNQQQLVAPENRDTFCHWLLNKDAFAATGGNDANRRGTITPYRRDSFILVGPGKDGLYGTNDDVTNFGG